MYQQIACHDGFRVLKLPYKAYNDDSPPAYNSKLREGLPEFSMCVFLPEDCDGLWSLLDRITARPEFLHEHLPRDHVPVGKFRLPKFKLTYMSSIRGVLKDLGLRLPFDPLLANMTGIVGDDESVVPLCVSEVVHKAVVEMNEEGCEAAAVTVESDDDLGFSLYCDYEYVPPPPTVDFVADHPFAFFIVEETSGTVVFAGHVLDPTKEE
ncbi:putative serpin-Z8 [Triticum aestivum]|uniref:Serpin domain-containing protein n=1 Tax=Triticum turgidum subsp. durum TaxID=4567 RepID=A0A9R1Q8M1_TRITD|nr:putative serpin-Z8 [Triticum aestivum]VAH72045.1 unnamed protein product [Triticum turgidum subsp. durum]